jgi:hypothetical protein
VEDDDRRAEGYREAAVPSKLRERRLWIVEQLRADPFVQVRSREAKTSGADVVLDAREVPHAPDSELETIDVEPGKPLDNRFVRRRIGKAIDEPVDARPRIISSRSWCTDDTEQR